MKNKLGQTYVPLLIISEVLIPKFMTDSKLGEADGDYGKLRMKGAFQRYLPDFSYYKLIESEQKDFFFKVGTTLDILNSL